jgi:hypothetical protein
MRLDELPAPDPTHGLDAEHTFTCLACATVFHTFGGNNWPEETKSTCGPCLTSPEPGPPREDVA